VHSEMRREAFD